MEKQVTNRIYSLSQLFYDIIGLPISVCNKKR